MQIVINIPDEIYNLCITDDYFIYHETDIIRQSIKNSTPLPKGHGRLIDADSLPLHAIDDANYGSNYIRIAPTVVESDK